MKTEPHVDHGKEFYQAFFDNSADAIFVLNNDLVIVDTNQAACDRLHYTKDELVGKTAVEINAPETQLDVKRYADALRTSGAARGEVIHVTKEGRKIPVEVNSRMITLDSEQLILTVARDISDRKAIENRLLQSQQHFRLLFENTGTANSFYDLHGRLVLCNQYGCRLLGYEDDRELVGKSFEEIFGKVQGEQFQDRLAKALADQTIHVHVTEIWREGKENWVQTSYIPLVAEDGQAVGVQIVSQDITQQKLYEKYLSAANNDLEAQVRERTRHLEVVLSQLQEAQNSIVENEKLAVLGRLSASVAHEVNNPLAAIQSSIGAIRSSLDSTLANGFRVFSTLSEDSRNHFRELLIQSDTGLRETRTGGGRSAKLKLRADLQEQRIEDYEAVADALTQLGLQTLDPAWVPLLALEHRAEILEAAIQISTLYRSTTIIATATAKATEFIRALRRFAYKETTLDAPEWFDLTGNIETVVLLLKSQIHPEIELVRDYGAKPLVLGFPNLLLQVWSNLIQNALQAMEDRGVLTIGVRVVANRILVEITDTGKGIPEHLREKIFEPFFTTKEVDKGTGLGLGIVTDALTQNRGTLEFESRPGKTTFRASLPLDTQP
jgi:PAS domain S-box-containing protein